MTAPNLQVNDPIATRQLLEISQYSYDVRYKPRNVNLTADQLSRPNGVPLGDAYTSDDVISAVKKKYDRYNSLKNLSRASSIGRS